MSGAVDPIPGGVVVGKCSKVVEFVCCWCPFCRKLEQSVELVVAGVVGGVVAFVCMSGIGVDAPSGGILRKINGYMVGCTCTIGCC